MCVLSRRIRTKEAEENLRIVSADDTTLLRVCEQCIRLGLPLVIEGVGETIESSLQPLLNRDMFDKKTSLTGTVRFNDVDIEFHPNFRVYFITQLNNPHFLPDVCIRVTLSKRPQPSLNSPPLSDVSSQLHHHAKRFGASAAQFGRAERRAAPRTRA